MFVHSGGTEMTFPEVVSAILVEEQGRSQADADRLVKRFPQIMVEGIMGGMQYRATALALEMKEREAAEAKGTTENTENTENTEGTENAENAEEQAND